MMKTAHAPTPYHAGTDPHGPDLTPVFSHPRVDSAWPAKATGFRKPIAEAVK